MRPRRGRPRTSILSSVSGFAWAARGWRLWQYAGDQTQGDGAFGDASRTVAGVSHCDRNLFAASQAGLVNNLNDGMSWGIFPLFFASFGLGVERIGILKAVYPATWGILQVATGPLSDLGYAIGAFSAGIIADLFGMAWAIGIIGALTFLSGTIVAAVMTNTSGRER